MAVAAYSVCPELSDGFILSRKLCKKGFSGLIFSQFVFICHNQVQILFSVPESAKFGIDVSGFCFNIGFDSQMNVSVGCAFAEVSAWHLRRPKRI